MRTPPIRSKEQLVAEIQRGFRPAYLFFWGHQPRQAGIADKSCFSQWFPAAFEVEGKTYRTAEHFMMAEKARLFGDAAMRQRILEAGAPGEAKKLGRLVKGFDDKAWGEARFEIVVRANLAKFSQHPALAEFLLATGSRHVIVEASPRDAIWGIGLGAKHEHAEQPARWRGLNLLGFALMEVRNRLRLAEGSRDLPSPVTA